MVPVPSHDTPSKEMGRSGKSTLPKRGGQYNLEDIHVNELLSPLFGTGNDKGEGI
jgi:hypothetical protein